MKAYNKKDLTDNKNKGVLPKTWLIVFSFSFVVWYILYKTFF